MRSMRVTRSPLVHMPAASTLLTVMTLVVAGTVVEVGRAEASPTRSVPVSAAAAGAAPTKSVASSDDGYVTASQPTGRSGGATTLIEGTSGTTRVVYLKFSVGSLPANTPVAVELFSERASSIAARLSVVPNT